MDQTVTLKIDGRDVSVLPGTTVLAAAKQVGIEIPSLCYQEKLLPAGLCRLCLVEIEKVRGLQPACSTAVREGMVVHTDTAPVLHNRRMVLELLCTNHPLDCPVCDAAGDCRLQDYVFRHGRTESRFGEEKRHKGKAIALGPAVVLDQERCVLCQRCVRFCEEVLDEHPLGVFQRGAQSRIGTLAGRPFDSPFSGNVVDLCPVGALTSRTFRSRARSWELKSYASTCGLCPVGCRLTADVRNGRLLRLRGREAPEVNDGWLCDLGRMGHGYTDHPDRLRQPLVRGANGLEPATWEVALAAVAGGFRRALRRQGPQTVAALGSPRLTNEAAYLLGRLMRTALRTNSVDCRLAMTTPLPAQATLGDLRRADVIVLFQGDPSEEAPILELWVKDAVKHGARLYVVHPRRLALERYATLALWPRPGSEAVLVAGALNAIAKAGAGKVPAGWQEALANSGPAQVASLTGCKRKAVEELAEALAGAQRGILAYGAGVRDEGSLALLAALAEATNVRLLGWNGGANMRGVADMGLRPDRLPGQVPLADAAARGRCQKAWGAPVPAEPGLPASELWAAVAQGRIRTLYIVGADPMREAPDPAPVERALAAAEFVVVQDSFLTATAARAHVVLPAAVWGEEDGSATNLAGTVGWQRAAIAPLGEARPHWSILVEVARRLEAPGRWPYASAADVLAEVAGLVPAYAGAPAVLGGGAHDARYAYAVGGGEPAAPSPWATIGPGSLALVTGPVLFDRDAYAGRTPAVAARAAEPYVALNAADAGPLGIADGSAVEVRGERGALRLRARVGEMCAPGMVFVPEELGTANMALLGGRPGVVALVEVVPVG